MKTILITSFHPLISRNILSAGVLKRLLDENIRIVLLVPQKKVQFFREHFIDKAVIIEGCEGLEKIGIRFFELVSLSLVGSENHIVYGWKTDGRYFRYYLAKVLYLLFSRFLFPRKILRWIFQIFYARNFAEDLFQKYNFDLVFATDIFGYEDSATLNTAKRHNVKTIGMVRSWDNATTKGVLLARPEQIIVTNGVLKKELEALHQFEEKSITITGIPHYDQMLDAPKISREDFFQEAGLHPERKTILFAPGGSIIYSHDRELLDLLQKSIEEQHFAHDVQIIVRFPPGDTVDVSTIEDDERFIIDRPGTGTTGKRKENEMSAKDNEHLMHSIHYSDVVVTLASTMIIDGMAMGKPVVVIGFDPQENLSDRISKFMRYPHLKKLLGSGLVTISADAKNFARDINRYINDPSLHIVQRKEIIRRYAYKLDGGAAVRVAEHVLKMLKTH